MGGRSLHALGERLPNNMHLKSLVTIRGAESCNWTSPADLTEPGWRHAGRECHDGKALVRLLLRVGEDSPARCGSAQESETSRGYALSDAHARGHETKVVSGEPNPKYIVHVVRRASEFDHENVDAPIHATDERVLK